MLVHQHFHHFLSAVHLRWGTVVQDKLLLVLAKYFMEMAAGQSALSRLAQYLRAQEFHSTTSIDTFSAAHFKYLSALLQTQRSRFLMPPLPRSRRRMHPPQIS